MLRSIYLQIKKIPVLGQLAVRARNKWQASSFQASRLRREGWQRAESWARELFPDQPDLITELKELRQSELFRQHFSYGHAGDFDVFALYLITRALKPEVVVETGVASGRSSSAILLALEKNNLGKLYSIDLPQHYSSAAPETYTTHEGNTELKGFVPEGRAPGWLVPDHLRQRWQLILGDSKVELPKLLSHLDKVDIFYHDSDHSYESMMFEFKQTWPLIPPGGFLLSDDIGWNKSWSDFVSESGAPVVKGYRNFGLIRK